MQGGCERNKRTSLLLALEDGVWAPQMGRQVWGWGIFMSLDSSGITKGGNKGVPPPPTPVMDMLWFFQYYLMFKVN